MSDVQYRLRRYQDMACHDSWAQPALAPDEPANIADIDLAGLERARTAYLQAIRIHLNPVRGRLCRG
jgi:hypothetical protein